MERASHRPVRRRPNRGLVVAFLPATALILGIIAWRAPKAGADTPLAQTGSVGTNALFDEAGNPGARCLYDPSSGAFTVTVDGPYVLGLDRVAGTEQTEVSWRAIALQDGTAVVTSPPVLGFAFETQSASFDNPIVLYPPDRTGRYTAQVEITWFDSVASGPPVVLGTSLRQVDVYAQNLEGTGGPDAIVDACRVVPDPTPIPTTTPLPTATTVPTIPPPATSTLPPAPTATTTPAPTATAPATATGVPGTATSTPVVTPGVTATATATVGPSGPSSITVSAPRGTVNSVQRVDLAGFPANTAVAVTFAGTTVASVTTTGGGVASTNIVIPARPQGSYEIRAAGGPASATATFAVVPRIKVTPGSGRPGDSVGVSLRGFAKNERVRIRWLVDGRFVEVFVVARTSNTGSANATVTVPAGADPGPTSVRGDGTIARAQTNAFVVTP